MLATHAGYGCLSVICTAEDGEHPFVFQARRIGRGLVPCAQLLYCRDMADIARFARPLGLFLLRRGLPCISLDANGPIEGLVGRYFDGKAPKYFKGPHRPRLGIWPIRKRSCSGREATGGYCRVICFPGTVR